MDECIQADGCPPEVTVAASPDHLASARSDWERILDESHWLALDPDPEFFLGILDGLEGRPQPYVVVIRDRGVPKGLLVARRARRSIICRVGYLSLRTPMLHCLDVVYGGLVTDESPRTWNALMSHLREMLDSESIQCIAFHHVPLQHSLCASLRSSLGAARGVRRPSVPHWSTELVDRGTGEEISQYSGRRRRKLRWYDNKLRERFGGDVWLRVATDRDTVEAFLVEASRISERSYQRGLGVGVRQDSRWRAILRTLADSGRLRSYLLVAMGDSVAYAAGAIHRGSWNLLATSYLPTYGDLSPGSYLLRRIIEDLRAAGVQRIDFGFGDAEYKRLYGNRVSEEADINLYGRGLRPGFARLMDASCCRLSGLARRLAETTGVARAIKGAWRHGLMRGS